MVEAQATRRANRTPEAASATATASTSSVEATLRTTLAATCPARTDGPPTSSERSRSTIPPVMSWLTLTAVVAEPNAPHTEFKFGLERVLDGDEALVRRG
jgi:hypothetical protein